MCARRENGLPPTVQAKDKYCEEVTARECWRRVSVGGVGRGGECRRRVPSSFEVPATPQVRPNSFTFHFCVADLANMAFGSAKVAASFQQHVQRDAMRFYEADAKGNSDHKLDFKEFLVMRPPAIKKSHTEAEIRGWFDAADTDGDGAVSINEFFVWTLQKEALNGMDGLRSLFECYDKDGTGCIDMHEFQRICDDLGFGGAAHQIFMDLDEDNSGHVQYSELIDRLMPSPESITKVKKSKAGAAYNPGSRMESDETKRFLMAVSWSANDSDTRFGTKLDISDWKVDAVDEVSDEAVEGEIKESGATVADLIELFNYENAGSRLTELLRCVGEGVYTDTTPEAMKGRWRRYVACSRRSPVRTRRLTSTNSSFCKLKSIADVDTGRYLTDEDITAHLEAVLCEAR